MRVKNPSQGVLFIQNHKKILNSTQNIVLIDE